jgi:hypothetical protein
VLEYDFFFGLIPPMPPPDHARLCNPKYFDHAISLGCILRHGTGTICFWEDDATINRDFISTMNEHLASLPDDWGMFFAGYTRIFDQTGNGLITTARTHHGNQCIVFRDTTIAPLSEAIFTHDIFRHGDGGIDTLFAPWCRDRKIGCYYASKSFVGQDECYSMMTNSMRPARGL